MRAKKCGMSVDERHFRRLNYCGTCKTIGSDYSAKARLLLNHDVVFLAEVLTSLSLENVADWQRPYQSFNCLSLPKDSIPRSLGWAAAANVVLAELKINDHIDDGEGRSYKFARSLFSSDFKIAEKQLAEWSFPLAEIKLLIESQSAREKAALSLDDLAFATAQTTAIFFRDGVRHIGRSELGNIAFDLGFNFGKMIYLIDAFEDFERDVRRGHFNAFRTMYAIKGQSIPDPVKRKIVALINSLENNLATKLRELPISKVQTELFVSRLEQNIKRKLSVHLPVLQTNAPCAKKPWRTLRDHYTASVVKARELSKDYSWQMPVVFAFVFVVALVAPMAHTRDAKSARECFDLGFNLMFLGAVFGSVLALPKTLFMEPPSDIASGVTKEAKKAVKQSDGSGGCCDCDGCDCCCDCGSCCECGDCC